ncbi:MAG: A24 family peptidase [Bryobacteraceae bacterium]
MNPLAPAIKIVLILLVTTAAIFDIRFRRIPNWLVLVGLILGFTVNIVLFGLTGLKTAGLGMLLGFGVYLLLHLLHAMGAGDVKLMAAVGSMVGPGAWFGIFLLTAMIGGVFALILLVLKGRLRQGLWNVGFIFTELSHFRAPYMTREELDVKSSKALRLPHGVTIAAGTLAYLSGLLPQ